MRRNKLKRAIPLLAAALLLSSCQSVEEAVTAPPITVKTKGITASARPKTAAPKTSAAPFVTTTSEQETVITAPAETELTNGIILTADNSVAPETESAEEETTASPTTLAPPEPADNTSETNAPPSDGIVTERVEAGDYMNVGANGILVAKINGHYWGLMGCYGTYSLCDSFAESENCFAAALPKVRAYSMLIPTSSEFYLPENAERTGFSTTSQLKKIRYTEELLKGITSVDAYSALYAHTDEPIFSRTDHHWQPLGAYYAAKRFSKDADFVFPDISEYKKVTRNDYVGSMYGYSKDTHLLKDPEEFAMYIPPNADKLKTTYYNTSFGGGYKGDLFTAPNADAYYCSFLGTDTCIAEIETDVKNGRTLVIFKESYGNGLVPFLTSGFEKIYVCDIRYFTKNAVRFCEGVGATDLLFAVCTYTVAGTNGNYLKIIQNQ